MTLLLRWLYQMLLLTLPSLPGRVTEIAFRRKHTAVSLVEGGKTKNVVVKSYSTDFAHGVSNSARKTSISCNDDKFCSVWHILIFVYTEDNEWRTAQTAAGRENAEVR